MLSKTSLQTLKALAELAKLPEGAWEGAASIAQRIDAPQNYLGKMLQKLSREGLVVSQKGMGGGFRLNKNPKKISLFDIVDPIENVSRWDGCFLGQKKCSKSAPCLVHCEWQGVRESYLKFLKLTTIADLGK
jgi:Rrf2 family protein